VNVNGPPRESAWKREGAATLAARGDFHGLLAELKLTLGLAISQREVQVLVRDLALVAFVRAHVSQGPLTLALVGDSPGLGAAAGNEAFSLKSKLSLFGSGKFAESQRAFESVVQSLLLVSPTASAARAEQRAVLRMARDSLVALRLEPCRRALGEGSGVRQLELAASLTHVRLEPAHVRLTLQSGMAVATKLKALGLASSFATRPTELKPGKAAEEKARRVLAAARGDVDPKLNYDARNPFVVCSAKLLPLYRGSPSVACPFAVRRISRRPGKSVQDLSRGRGGRECGGRRRTAARVRLPARFRSPATPGCGTEPKIRPCECRRLPVALAGECFRVGRRTGNEGGFWQWLTVNLILNPYCSQPILPRATAI
jgi:hypothetical protein